ncbi:MAG: hypothetical protein DRN27_04970 [Thermoplasmata archaeon]|nr:MAG: hypothetical protein DRN27_04970 [Thermoplasmata archaeon]
MGLGKIIGIILAIPALILVLIPMFIQFWVEGLVTDALLSAFGISPIIGVLITIAGIIIFITAVIVALIRIL